MTMKLRTTMLVLLVAVSTAAAVAIGPFTSWDELTKKSPDIIIARCVTAPDPTVIGDGRISSDIEVLAVLKGDTKPGVAHMVSLYWPHQDARFLMFATYQSNQLYRAYNATETYRIVPLSRYFLTSALTGKSLDEQIQLVLRRRLEDVNRELERDTEEKSRLALAVSGNLTGSPSPYEIVLEGENVVFDKAESVSMQIIVRNLGMKKLIAPELYWGLSVVWDGKEYKRDHKHIGTWNGHAEITPKTVWRTGFSLSEYLIPAEALTAGRHTMALRDAFTESNTLTVFIEKTK
jgi:hypothetical protein